MRAKFFICLTLLLSSLAAAAEPTSTQRPVRSEYAVVVGEGRLWSTYLSPLQYRGWELALDGSWEKVFNHWNDQALMRFDAELAFTSALNPSKMARMLSLTAMFDWGLEWRALNTRHWTASLGGCAEILAGVMYLPRNGNNPASAIAAPGLCITGAAAYNFKMGRLPVTVTDRFKLPALSIFFMPEYGESYYEIYLGNRAGLVHCGWFGTAPGVENTLKAELHLGRCSLTLGWRYALRQWDANNLHNRLTDNAALIGIAF